MKPDLVGLYEIAERLGTTTPVVGKWRERSRPGGSMNPPFPKARYTFRMGPLWDWNRDIYPWLEKCASKGIARRPYSAARMAANRPMP